MPITRKQFELEIDAKTEEWMGKIQGFLAAHEDEAFTAEELRQHYSPALAESLDGPEKYLWQVGGSKDPFALLPNEKKAFDLALEKLVETGAAEKRVIRDTSYYAFNEEGLPF